MESIDEGSSLGLLLGIDKGSVDGESDGLSLGLSHGLDEGSVDGASEG